MTLWRMTRNEMAGAWRSLRYDLGRRAEQPPAAGREPVPDVTSTGMSTFGGVTGAGYRDSGYDEPGYDEPARPGRRLVAAGAFVTLAVVGVAGSYLAVVSGLGGVLRNDSAAAGERPLAAAGPAGGADGADATSGLGRGPALVPDVTAAQPVPALTSPAATTAPAPARPARPPSRPANPGTPPTREGCDCLTPPVPTPAAPPSPTPAPSPSASTSPSPGVSESSDPASPSAEPSESGNSPEMGRLHRAG